MLFNCKYVLHKFIPIIIFGRDTNFQIKLEEPLNFSSNVQPIRLVAHTPDSGEKAIIIGWGVSGNSNIAYCYSIIISNLDVIKQSDYHLRFGHIMVVSNETCLEYVFSLMLSFKFSSENLFESSSGRLINDNFIWQSSKNPIISNFTVCTPYLIVSFFLTFRGSKICFGPIV